MVRSFSLRRSVLLSAIASVAAGLSMAPTASAAVSSADQVSNYSPGTLTGSYVAPSASYTSGPGLGIPASTEGGIYGDDSIITPFNGQYNPANMFALAGTGGFVELHLSSPVATNGYTLGVFTGIGLNDTNYPNGVTGATASYYNSVGRSATMEVSADGTHWVALGDQIFDNPTNAYSDVAMAQTSTPGNTPADYSKAFTGNLASFNNENFTQVLSTLNGSAGGTWFNLSGTGLSQVNYVEFSTSASETMYVQGITGTAVAVPEPAMGLMLVGAAVLLRRKRRMNDEFGM